MAFQKYFSNAYERINHKCKAIGIFCYLGNLPPRLAKLQQQQLQQQQQAVPPPSQQQAMMMMQDGQMPIPLPNTAVPPPPLPKQEEISLRPNRNFTTALRPSVPTMLPKSAQAAPSTGAPLMTGNPSMMDQRVNNLNPLLAKQVSYWPRSYC